jgi:hypothetical protein
VAVSPRVSVVEAREDRREGGVLAVGEIGDRSLPDPRGVTP